MTPFESAYFSHKFHDAGVRYDVALNIVTGDIVYWGGGYPAGKYPDLVIARMGIIPLLRPGKKIIADKGYGIKTISFTLPTSGETIC